MLRNAETLNLLGIAKGVVDIAQRARDKKLLPDEVQGGTLRSTNPGGYGTFHGTPVISQPQAATSEPTWSSSDLWWSRTRWART